MRTLLFSLLLLPLLVFGQSNDRVLRAKDLFMTQPWPGSNAVKITTVSFPASYTLTLPQDDGTSGQLLSTDGSGLLSWYTPTVGTVTSIGLSAPSSFQVTNSPVTSSGTIGISYISQPAKYFLGGPPSGNSSPPTFRPFIDTDIPLVSLASGVRGTLSATSGGTGLNSYATGDILIASSASTISGLPLGTNKNIVMSNGTYPSYVSGDTYFANTKLSNLTFTDVNADLNFNTGATAVIKTIDQVGATENMYIRTGTSSGANSGQIRLWDGYANSGTSGGILLWSNSNTVDLQGTSTRLLTTSGANALKFYDVANTSYMALRGPTSGATNVTWQLPQTDGSNGQVLATDGSGNLNWANAVSSSTGITVLGIASGGTNNTTFSSGAVTFYDGSKITGDVSNLSWRQTERRLGVGTNFASYPLHIVSSGAPSTSTAFLTLENNHGTALDTFGIDFINTGYAGSSRIQSILDAGGTTSSLQLLSDGASPTLGIHIAGTGKVGINKTAPSYELDVNGNIATNSKIYAGANLTTGSGAVNISGSLAFVSGVNQITFALPSLISSSTAYLWPSQDGTNGYALVTNGSGQLSWANAAGTVTSVGLSMPSLFEVTNTPVTGAGTLTVATVSQAANASLMGPPTGTSSPPTFRSITQNDLPLISAVSGITGIVSAPNGGTGQGSWVRGDLLVAKGTNNISSIPIGTADYVLAVNGTTGLPYWTSNIATVVATQLAPTYISIAAASTPPTTVQVIHADASAGSFTVRYPGAASVTAGSLLIIRKTDTTTKVVSGAEGLSKHLYTPYEEYKFQSDGSAWRVLSHQTEYTWNPEVISTRGVVSGPTKGTTSTDRVVGTRQGKNLCLRYAYFSTGTGNNGSGTYNLLLPTYISTPNQIDSSAITLYTGTTVMNAFGGSTDTSSACYFTNTATIEDRGRLYPVTVDMLRLVSNVFNGFWGSGVGGFGGQIYMTCNICLPMSGWED